MNETLPIIRLDLRAPLFYAEAPELDPFNIASLDAQPPDESAPEYLFCFELDQEQAQSIEPQPELFLGRLLFSGKSVENQQGDRTFKESQLPAAQYLFAQKREVLDREAIIDMAIEQQKDGLWEKNKLENLLFLRLLHEDNSPVTQLFRPIKV